MKKINPAKILVGAFCVLILLSAIVVAVILDSRSPDPVLGIFRTEPTEQTNEATNTTGGGAENLTEGTNTSTDGTEGLTEETSKPAGGTAPSGGQITPPEDLPSSVVIPTDKDPQTGEPTGITFPCQVPEYGLVIEKMAPYNGMFVEDGSNANVQNVAMLLVHNNGDFPVEYTQICVEYGQDKLLFDISALPVGERLVVQEKTGKTMPEGQATHATALVVQRANMEMSEGKICVTDNGDNTLTIQNLTGEEIPAVRVFYKYYMEAEEIFVGGIAFTVQITRLGGGASVTVQPSHYASQTSRVVMVLTYDSEV